jgi:hypothetical protein
MGNIMPVTHTLDGPALMYACHQYQKNIYEVLEVIIQNQQANRNNTNQIYICIRSMECEINEMK